MFIPENKINQPNPIEIEGGGFVYEGGGGGGGDVFGPASSVSDDIALFDGTTGKLLKDSGMKLNTGTTAGTVPVRDANGKVPGCLTIDDLYPVNIGIYTQYPAANSNVDATAFPVSQRPAALFPGTTWEEVWGNEAITFRTPGSPVENQNDDRINGLQTDQMQGHYHDVLYTYFSRSTGGNYVYGVGGGTTSGSAATTIKTDTVNGNPRVGAETRMRNRLWKKWRRIA